MFCFVKDHPSVQSIIFKTNFPNWTSFLLSIVKLMWRLGMFLLLVLRNCNVEIIQNRFVWVQAFFVRQRSVYICTSTFRIAQPKFVQETVIGNGTPNKQKQFWLLLYQNNNFFTMYVRQISYHYVIHKNGLAIGFQRTRSFPPNFFLRKDLFPLLVVQMMGQLETYLFD